ncbi:MAG TPA: TA system VapC family ribonuclease toxin [Bryobacteraceae bacterium]|jgi:hypothetical protein
MSSLIFPDLNVWLALTVPEHVHYQAAHRWWKRGNERIAFSRFTQMGYLRLLTTAASMGGKPLTIDEAWKAYDRLYKDDRIVFAPEPPAADLHFRKYAAARTSSPKLWGDAWLLAMAEAAGGSVATFDRGLAARGEDCVLLS